MIKTNYHTHCYLCKHAEGLPIDYIKRAVELGMKEIGITDHGPIPKPEWTRRMNFEEYKNIYLPNLDKSINLYGDKIKIFKGVEIEFFPEFTEYYKELLKDLDYLVLGQHDLVVDGYGHDIYKSMNAEIVKIYEKTVIKGLNSGLFRVLAHPEIFMFKYRSWDETAKNASKNIIEAAIKNNVLLEVNANGARRGTIETEEGIKTWIYPRYEFWKLVSEYHKAKIIINDDAHLIKHLQDNATIQVYEFAKKLNLNVVEYLFEDKYDKI